MQTIKTGRNMALKTGVIALMIGLAASMAQAADDLRAITVSGQGSAAAAPDMATISMGVTEQNAEAREAMQLTSDKVTEILSQLEQLGLESGDIQTQRITVNPIWANRNNGDEPPEITGFVASNSISVRVRDLPRLGEVMDRILSVGANDVSGLQFSIQDPEPLTNEARRDAVADAMAKAQLYADAAGVTLGPVQSLTEQGGNPRPMMMEMAAARDMKMPVAEGEVSIDASVSMVFQIAD